MCNPYFKKIFTISIDNTHQSKYNLNIHKECARDSPDDHTATCKIQGAKG